MKSIKNIPMKPLKCLNRWNMILGVAGQKAISRTCFECSSIWWNWFSRWSTRRNFTPAVAVSGELCAWLHSLYMCSYCTTQPNKYLRKANSISCQMSAKTEKCKWRLTENMHRFYGIFARRQLSTCSTTKVQWIVQFHTFLFNWNDVSSLTRKS